MPLGEVGQLDEGAHLVAADRNGRQVGGAVDRRRRLVGGRGGRASREQAGESQGSQPDEWAFGAHARYERLKTTFG